MFQKIAMWLCSVRGHRLPEFKHPQQVGVECCVCKYIVDRSGKVIRPPLGTRL